MFSGMTFLSAFSVHMVVAVSFVTNEVLIFLITENKLPLHVV